MLRLARSLLGVFLIAVVVLMAIPHSTQANPSVLLAKQAPYSVGFQFKQVTDSSRNGRTLVMQVWYPAIAPAKPTQQQQTLSQYGWYKALPDSRAAPYPLILDSPALQTSVGSLWSLADLDMLLASQGFVVATLLNGHPNDDSQKALIDRPLDILFMLDQLTAANGTEFGNVMDTDHVGVMGGLLGTYTALTLTGAEIDPAVARVWANKPPRPADQYDVRNVWANDWKWDDLVAYRATFAPPLPNDDNLWPAFSDPRIRAALIIQPCVTNLFGERGLAAATLPALMLDATGSWCPNDLDGINLFAHLGSKERYPLTVTNLGHSSDLEGAELNQIETSFFALYLKSSQKDARYMTARYVDNVEAVYNLGVVWGLYNGG